MPIAPEGWPFIAPAWVLAGVGLWGATHATPWLWALEAPLLVIAIWLIVFFRDPQRAGPRGGEFLVAPADGKIVEIAVVPEPMFLNEEATRISTFMNVFNVHVNRYPLSGEVALVRYNRGKFLHAGAEKASLVNEQASVGIRGPRGGVLVRQIAGLVARRIVTDARAGAHAAQGERLGMIRFGSRVDLFIPRSSRVRMRVAVGDHVRAGASLLAEYTP